MTPLDTSNDVLFHIDYVFFFESCDVPGVLTVFRDCQSLAAYLRTLEQSTLEGFQRLLLLPSDNFKFSMNGPFTFKIAHFVLNSFFQFLMKI